MDARLLASCSWLYVFVMFFLLSVGYVIPNFFSVASLIFFMLIAVFTSLWLGGGKRQK